MDKPKLSILLIDEDLPSRNYMGSLLSRQGYSVQAVSSGKEGYIAALRDKPDIIIFDIDLTDIPVKDLVGKLRSDRRTAGALCIALTTASNSSQADAILEAGCHRFFVKNQESVDQLLTLLAAPLPLETGILKKQAPGGLVGVFLSAKGGMGTSSICANVAQNISTTFPEIDVAVMDLVFPIGSISSIVGYDLLSKPDDFNLQTAASIPPTKLNAKVLQKALLPLENWRFRFLAGSPDPEIAGKIESENLLAVTRVFRQAFGLTLIDLGRSLSNVNLSIIQEADVVVIVTNTDLATIKLTQSVWQYLQRKGISAQRVYMMINRSMGLEGLSKSDAERILGLEIRATTPHLGGTFALANNQHLPILVKLPNDTAAMLIKQISREIVETARRNHG